MPTVLFEGPYRFYFYMRDLLTEPPHVHVERDRDEAKFWLDPVRLERGRLFPARTTHDSQDRRRQPIATFGGME
jgi:hypothetical protein